MRLHHLLPALLLLAHAVAAQTTEKEAISALKAASKASLKTLKQSAADSVATANDGIDAIADSLAGELEPSEVAGTLSAVLNIFLAEIDDALSEELQAVELAALNALNDLGNRSSLEGLYPDDFLYGTGGVLDDNRAAAVKAAGKACTSVSKRLAKLEKTAESESGMALVAKIRYPTRDHATAVMQITLQTKQQTSTIDLVIAASNLGVASDGVLIACGRTDYPSQLGVGYFGGEDAGSEVPASALGGGRFGGAFTELPEGGYVVFTENADDGVESAMAIGLR